VRLIKLPIYESPGPVPDLLDAAVNFSGDAATALEPSDDAIGEESNAQEEEEKEKEEV
jgi:hypothetical protein